MRKALVVAAVLSFSGCATRLYQARITAPDSRGRETEHVLYWNHTPRKLWFKTDKGAGMRVLSECGGGLVFSETDDGIVFRPHPDFSKTVGPAAGDCGRVLGHKKIGAVGEGDLQLTVLCSPAEGDEFTIVARDSYLKARAEPYRFPVTMKKTKKLDAEAPKPRPCRY